MYIVFKNLVYDCNSNTNIETTPAESNDNNDCNVRTKRSVGL